MPEFYTVARRDISNLKQLELLPHTTKPVVEVETLVSAEETLNLLKEFYPNGLSSHGVQYLLDRFYWRKDEHGNDYVNYIVVMEQIFELIRLLKFPHLPSRFTSYFAWETVEDALKFKKNMCRGNGKIYKVSSEEYFKADMSLLLTGSITASMIIASKYWSGMNSPSPLWEILMVPPVDIRGEVDNDNTAI